MSAKGIVFDIQRFTISDGPGVRTEVFLKGCLLRCRWCSNPEGLSRAPEPGVYRDKCISQDSCGDCLSVCDENALIFSQGKLTGIDRGRCTNCFKCADVCPSDAIRIWGEEMSVSDCKKIILRDKGYYERSGGGVTLSGGEPLVQSDFAAELLKACKEEGIHTCIESAMSADWEHVEKVLPYTDLFIADIKHMDSRTHEIFTGSPNEKILENLQRLSRTDKDIILRIPVIPGVNDDEKNVQETADFILNEMNGRVMLLQLLSYMRLGIDKYESLGIGYGMEDLEFDREKFQDRVRGICDYFSGRGIECRVGTIDKKEGN